MKEHMTAKDLKEKIDPNIFNNYFKFVTVRNPFDQIISAYYWHNESKKDEKKFLFFKKKPISFDKFFSRKALKTNFPILPNPLIATLILLPLCYFIILIFLEFFYIYYQL